MISEAFITCAAAGAGDTVARSEHVPVTPDQIADVDPVLNLIEEGLIDDRPAGSAT